MGRESESGAVGTTEYPTTPLLLEKKPRKNNILIGNDPAQIRFAEQFLSMEFGVPIRHEQVPMVKDDMLLGVSDPKLYLVDADHQIDISPNVANKTGIFSLDLIGLGSSGLNAVIRYAAKLMDREKPTKEEFNRVGRELVREFDTQKKQHLLGDIRAAVWQAAWLLCGPPEGKLGWMAPWENWQMWMPRGGDPRFRLNALYRELIMWVFAQNGDDKGFKKTGGSWDAKRWLKLSKTNLPKDKVYATLSELSAWRTHSYDPYVCILRISKIWETK